jgi:hypothetical protein
MNRKKVCLLAQLRTDSQTASAETARFTDVDWKNKGTDKSSQDADCWMSECSDTQGSLISGVCSFWMLLVEDS